MLPGVGSSPLPGYSFHGFPPLSLAVDVETQNIARRSVLYTEEKLVFGALLFASRSLRYGWPPFLWESRDRLYPSLVPVFPPSWPHGGAARPAE